MAISKSFFGLRRGSTKSLTFSIYKGKQVTKDRVAFVKNPNTIAQRLQRMKFLAMQLLLNAGLGDIIDHSWENKKYGSESRQYFSSKALKLSGPFIGKDQNSAVPMPVQISEGTLPTIDVTLSQTAGSQVVPNGVKFAFNPEAQSLFPGEQVTLLFLANGVLYVDRWIMQEYVPATKETPAPVYKFLHNGQVEEISDAITMVIDEQLTKDTPVAYGGILSKYLNGKWQRSTQFMQMNTAAEDAYYTADAMNVAVQSWDTKANENMLSNWYLNLSDSVYDGADVVIAVKTQSAGNTKVRARMVNVQGELIPYIYTTTGTAAGNCITASGARSSVLGSAIVGAIGFVQWGTLGNSTGNNNGAQGGSTDPIMP